MAFFPVAFVIAHVYLTTTGHTVLSNVQAMITGWEEERPTSPAPGRSAEE